MDSPPHHTPRPISSPSHMSPSPWGQPQPLAIPKYSRSCPSLGEGLTVPETAHSSAWVPSRPGISHSPLSGFCPPLIDKCQQCTAHSRLARNIFLFFLAQRPLLSPAVILQETQILSSLYHDHLPSLSLHWRPNAHHQPPADTGSTPLASFLAHPHASQWPCSFYFQICPFPVLTTLHFL